MTFNTESSRCAFNCSLCSKTAGVVEVLPAGHPNGLAEDSSTVCISGFIGEERMILSASTQLALRKCLAAGDPAGVYNLEGLWVPFYCPACARVYCVEHWTVIPKYDDDFVDFFDCSHGYCPEGHKRLIED